VLLSMSVDNAMERCFYFFFFNFIILYSLVILSSRLAQWASVWDGTTGWDWKKKTLSLWIMWLIRYLFLHYFTFSRTRTRTRLVSNQISILRV